MPATAATVTAVKELLHDIRTEATFNALLLFDVVLKLCVLFAMLTETRQCEYTQAQIATAT